MIKYILIMCCLLVATGCVSLKVTQPDGTKYKYVRFGRQSIEGFAYSRDGDKVDLLLDKAAGESQMAEMLAEAIKRIPIVP